MAVLRVNAAADGTVRLAGSAGPVWQGALAQALRALPPGAPIVILIHGYRYSWRSTGRRDPHRTLYRAEPMTPCTRVKPRTANWPHALGFSEHGHEDGLCIAFGWDAWAAGAGPRCFAEAHRRAARTGEALASLVGDIARLAPGREVDCVTHSLGARVVIQALTAEPGLPIGRAIFMGGADYTAEAHAMLAAQDAVRATTAFYHVMARANDVYDLLFEVFAPTRPKPGDRPLGARGLGMAHPRWLDIQLDLPDLADWLRAQGHRLERQGTPVSHWAFYADPGAMRLYCTILRDRAEWSIPALIARGIPRRIEHRWSRLAPTATVRHGMLPSRFTVAHEA